MHGFLLSLAVILDGHSRILSVWRCQFPGDMLVLLCSACRVGLVCLDRGDGHGISWVARCCNIHYPFAYVWFQACHWLYQPETSRTEILYLAFLAYFVIFWIIRNYALVLFSFLACQSLPWLVLWQWWFILFTAMNASRLSCLAKVSLYLDFISDKNFF